MKSASVYFDYDEADAYFAYDENDRLTREYRVGTAGRWGPAPWGLFGWGGADATYFDYDYDLAGNRTKHGVGTVFESVYGTYFNYDSTYYEYANDDSLTKRWRADTGAGTYYEYDKTGSCEKIVSPGGITYFEYTHANLVSRMVELGGSDFQFAYDGSLQRYAIVEDGTATYFLWDDLRLMETRNADYTLKARFAHAGPPASGGVEGIGTCTEVYRASDGKRLYLLYDHRGSAHVVLDENKAVVATRLYNAYGEIISETGTWPDEVPFGYQSNWLAPPGMTLPDGTQLYLSARVYDPGAGRFLQRDFRRTPGENPYVYALNNPVNLVDAKGLDPDDGLPCLPDFKKMSDEEVRKYLEDQLLDLGKAAEGTQDFHNAFIRSWAALDVLNGRGLNVNVQTPGFSRKRRALREGVAKLVSRRQQYFRFAMVLEKFTQKHDPVDLSPVEEGRELAGTVMDILEKLRLASEKMQGIAGGMLELVGQGVAVSRAISDYRAFEEFKKVVIEAGQLGFILHGVAERVPTEPGSRETEWAPKGSRFLAKENIGQQVLDLSSVISLAKQELARNVKRQRESVGLEYTYALRREKNLTASIEFLSAELAELYSRWPPKPTTIGPSPR